MSVGSVEVGPARAGDRQALLELLRAQLDEHDLPLSGALLQASIDGVLQDPRRGCFLLARQAGGGAAASETAVGVAYVAFIWSLEHGGLSAWLEELYVRPACRDQGIGRRLLLAACEQARAAGCAAMDLEVEEEHQRAARLYAREGFRPHRRTRWVRLLRDAGG